MNTPKLAALTTALTFAVAAAQTNTTVTIRRQHAQAVREPRRTTFYVPAIITWGTRYRALAATIVRDHHGRYRFTGFTIL